MGAVRGQGGPVCDSSSAGPVLIRGSDVAKRSSRCGGHLCADVGRCLAPTPHALEFSWVLHIIFAK